MCKPSNTPIVISSGEPAGIGPDICLQIAQNWQGHAIVIAGDLEMLQARAKQLDLSADYPIFSHDAIAPVSILPVAGLAEPVTAGELNPNNAAYVIHMLSEAVAGCMAGRFAALVTAPAHKSVINDAGIAFSGHTEWLQAETNSDTSLMTFINDELTLSLLTTHCPLREVSQHITVERVIEGITTLHHFQQQPITILGLNPHAGEQGHLGDEEITTLAPAIAHCRSLGITVSDPMPADTVFATHQRHLHPVVLSMYHDQALPVIKALSFGKLTQCTLGLPITRFSVDHGTACALAGTGQAKADSLRYTLQQTQHFLQAS